MVEEYKKRERRCKVYTLLSRSDKNQTTLPLPLSISSSKPIDQTSGLHFNFLRISHLRIPDMSEDQKPQTDDHLSPKLDEEIIPRGLEEFSGENGDLRQPEDDQGLCRTPVSEDHKIPTARSCPATPRKQAAPASSRKRKSLHFFEDSGREEVELFFRTSLLELFSNKADKRRCTSV